MQNIHTVPAGSTGPSGAVAGSVTGVASYSDDVTLDTQAFVDANIAVVEIEDGIDLGEIIGGRITPRAAGLAPPTTFADQAALESDLTRVPDIYVEAGVTVYWNGTKYVREDSIAHLGDVATVTISDAGNGYTVGTFIDVSPISSSGIGMTVEITSVGGNGEVLGVTVDTAGVGYAVGDTMNVIGGAGNCELTVGTLDEKIIGVLNTGRGASNQASANDINPSYFTELPFEDAESDLELYIPSTGQVLTYDASLPAPYKFDSLGDCFTGGDFRVHIRRVGDTNILSEIICPGPQDVNSDVDLPFYYS